MKRLTLQPRLHWQQKVQALGLTYHSHKGKPYWDESVCYEFTAEESSALVSAAKELQARCIEAVHEVITRDWFHRFGISSEAAACIRYSWQRDGLGIIGRFDLAWDGVGPAKMLEYNADTPTGVFEASIVQDRWLREVLPERIQCNTLHKDLISAWQALRAPAVHFAAVLDAPEDSLTTHYLAQTCQEAGTRTTLIDMQNIGFHHREGRFVDLLNRPMEKIFKLYPWEWMWDEVFGTHLPGRCGVFLEPVWKMILSNKAILPILWELFPGHPHLLPAFETPDRLGGNYVKKPKLGREGSNITIYGSSKPAVSTAGHYGSEGYVFQALAPFTDFEGQHPEFGLWMVAGEPAGLGIREESQAVVHNDSRFVPHCIC
jgi:glutathionylspermidine synthase